MNFEQIGNGQVEGYCLIKTLEKKTSSRGSQYLDMTVADKDGEMNAKFWDYNEQLHSHFASGDIIKIRGTVSPYNGIDQLKIERIRSVNDSDKVNPADFVPSADCDPQAMFDALVDIVENFEDPYLKKLVLEVYNRYKKELLYVPAAFKLHHAMRGGLLYHVLSIVRLAEGVCKVYPFVDRDLLIAGAMVHDIAKISEFSLNKTGLVEDYSTKGNLLGHIPMGAMIIDNIAKEIGIPEETAMLIEHMILSHHGNPEYGAAVRPMFLEAELLSELDLMDSRVYEIIRAVEPLEKGAFSSRQWALDNVKLYNHARGTLDTGAKLL